jgi:hypothetical protein
MSEDGLMVRSPKGAVWIQLNGDINEGPPATHDQRSLLLTVDALAPAFCGGLWEYIKG